MFLSHLWPFFFRWLIKDTINLSAIIGSLNSINFYSPKVFWMYQYMAKYFHINQGFKKSDSVNLCTCSQAMCVCWNPFLSEEWHSYIRFNAVHSSVIASTSDQLCSYFFLPLFSPCICHHYHSSLSWPCYFKFLILVLFG